MSPFLIILRYAMRCATIDTSRLPISLNKGFACLYILHDISMICPGSISREYSNKSISPDKIHEFIHPFIHSFTPREMALLRTPNSLHLQLIHTCNTIIITSSNDPSQPDQLFPHTTKSKATTPPPPPLFLLRQPPRGNIIHEAVELSPPAVLEAQEAGRDGLDVDLQVAPLEPRPAVVPHVLLDRDADVRESHAEVVLELGELGLF